MEVLYSHRPWCAQSPATSLRTRLYPDLRGSIRDANRRDLRALKFEAYALLAPLLGLGDKQAVAAVTKRRFAQISAGLSICLLLATAAGTWFYWTNSGAVFSMRRQLRARLLSKTDLVDSEASAADLRTLVILGEPLCASGGVLYSAVESRSKKPIVQTVERAAENFYVTGDEGNARLCAALLRQARGNLGWGYSDESNAEMFALIGQPEIAEQKVNRIRQLPDPVGNVKPFVLRLMLIIAKSYHEVGKSDKARSVLDDARNFAMQGHPGFYNTEKRCAIDRVQAEIGDREGALADLKKQWSEGFVYPVVADTGEVDEALRMNDELSGRASDAHFLFLLARASFRNGDDARAQSFLAEAAPTATDFFPSWYELAQKLEDEGRHEQAVEVRAKIAAAYKATVGLGYRPDTSEKTDSEKFREALEAVADGDYATGLQRLQVAGLYDPKEPSKSPSFVVNYRIEMYVQQRDFLKAKSVADEVPDVERRLRHYASIFQNSAIDKNPVAHKRQDVIDRLKVPAWQ